MNVPKPRPIEFMLRGISVAKMYGLLAEWDTLSDIDLAALGFLQQPKPPTLRLVESTTADIEPDECDVTPAMISARVGE